MKEQLTINWSQAQEISKEAQQQEEAHAKEYQENLNHAKRELFDAMGTKDFRTSDFFDICMSYGIDQDDLIEELI